ncbi:NAD(P)-dependent oxidoreductase [Spiroplasma clarkii]|uniref:D-lactate dehydrogenase n=1 Tax=Spiroplasma clarkii TaxID=2139 RepID=A0A2K8KJK7_9MOLU|nr:NAD(P)-dependent oxidoreductase [Spiroplasma clarkii]ATX70549.1 D-lactate dehydrogenase [Spiroplasma clarkii]
MKVICFGVRDVEKPIFEDVNKKFGFEMTLVPELLTHENVEITKGHDAVLLRANCVADQQNLEKMWSYNIKYMFTRTVGVNHIDVEAAKKIGFKLAYVPFYSPNAVSELAFSLGLAMLRNIIHMAKKMEEKDFTVDAGMFAYEARNSTIGIIGTGRIGFECAKAWKGMGARVLGYDLYPRTDATGIIEYKSFEDIMKESDLISLHCPYIKGQNDNLISKKSLALAKDGLIIVNAARGELINNEDLYDALVSGKVKQAALDTLTNEGQVFFKKHSGKLPVDVYEKLYQLKPRVIFTPHIGSFTDEAVKNMVETSFENLKEYSETRDCKNKI